VCRTSNILQIHSKEPGTACEVCKVQVCGAAGLPACDRWHSRDTNLIARDRWRSRNTYTQFCIRANMRVSDGLNKREMLTIRAGTACKPRAKALIHPHFKYLPANAQPCPLPHKGSLAHLYCATSLRLELFKLCSTACVHACLQAHMHPTTTVPPSREGQAGIGAGIHAAHLLCNGGLALPVHIFSLHPP